MSCPQTLSLAHTVLPLHVYQKNLRDLQALHVIRPDTAIVSTGKWQVRLSWLVSNYFILDSSVEFEGKWTTVLAFEL